MDEEQNATTCKTVNYKYNRKLNRICGKTNNDKTLNSISLVTWQKRQF